MAVGPATSAVGHKLNMAVGSVSGGCVEGAVYEAAEAMLADAKLPRIEFFGYSDETAFANGLSCGGELEIFVETIDAQTFPFFGDVCQALRDGQAVAIATVIDGPSPGRHLAVFRDGESRGSVGGAHRDASIRATSQEMLANGLTGCIIINDADGLAGPVRVFVQSFVPPPRMLIFGAIDFAGALSDAAKLLGYRVTVCDARPTFATAQRFPGADEVVLQWPHRYLQEQYDGGELDRRTVACVLTHDVKFDVPLLVVALGLPLAYVGAMGSRRTHAEREKLLLEAGTNRRTLAKLRSPIGLNLGATGAPETAVSILAEVIAVRNKRSSVALSATEEAIHRPLPENAPEYMLQNRRVSIPLPATEGTCHV